MKSLIIKIILYLLSKLNRKNKRDILENIKYLISLANGKQRDYLKICRNFVVIFVEDFR